MHYHFTKSEIKTQLLCRETKKKTNLVKGQIGPIEMVEGSKSDQILVSGVIQTWPNFKGVIWTFSFSK